MNSLLISYDVPTENSDVIYEKIIQRIKQYGFWAKPLESVWIIKTSKTANEVRDELIQFSAPNIKLFVVDVTSSFWASFNISDKVTDWLKNNI